MRYLIVILALVLVSLSASAQTRYVTDQFEVMLRTGPSTKNAIVRALDSGARLELLETDSDAGYTKVRTESGKEGWVLSRYLMSQPAARSQLASMNERLETMRNRSGGIVRELDDAKQQVQRDAATIRDLKNENNRLQAELGEIKRTAANVLTINAENKTLRSRISDAEIATGTLRRENEQLTSRNAQNWFLIGAAVVIIGIVIGLIMPKLLSMRRRSRYSDSF